MVHDTSFLSSAVRVSGVHGPLSISSDSAELYTAEREGESLSRRPSFRNKIIQPIKHHRYNGQMLTVTCSSIVLHIPTFMLSYFILSLSLATYPMIAYRDAGEIPVNSLIRLHKRIRIFYRFCISACRPLYFLAPDPFDFRFE